MGLAEGKDEEELSERALALLERRAARLRARPVVADNQDAVLWVAELPVGGDMIGVPLSRVRAVVPLRTVTPVPLAPAHVIGIMRFQGQLISALSLVSLLGVRGWRFDPSVLLVVEASEDRLVALDSEQIPKAVSVPLSLVEQARARAAGQPIVEVSIEGTGQLRLVDDLVGLVEGRLGDARGD